MSDPRSGDAPGSSIRRRRGAAEAPGGQPRAYFASAIRSARRSPISGRSTRRDPDHARRRDRSCDHRRLDRPSFRDWWLTRSQRAWPGSPAPCSIEAIACSARRSGPGHGRGLNRSLGELWDARGPWGGGPNGIRRPSVCAAGGAGGCPLQVVIPPGPRMHPVQAACQKHRARVSLHPGWSGPWSEPAGRRRASSRARRSRRMRAPPGRP